MQKSTCGMAPVKQHSHREHLNEECAEVNLRNRAAGVARCQREQRHRILIGIGSHQ